jgi:hypothetical protein
VGALPSGEIKCACCNRVTANLNRCLMKMLLLVLMTWGAMGYALVPDDILEKTQNSFNQIVASN